MTDINGQASPGAKKGEGSTKKRDCYRETGARRTAARGAGLALHARLPRRLLLLLKHAKRHLRQSVRGGQPLAVCWEQSTRVLEGQQAQAAQHSRARPTDALTFLRPP